LEKKNFSNNSVASKAANNRDFDSFTLILFSKSIMLILLDSTLFFDDCSSTKKSRYNWNGIFL
jgi:hypothetical protein